MTRERFEQILFAHVSDEVVQDMLNEYVLELESSDAKLRELCKEWYRFAYELFDDFVGEPELNEDFMTLEDRLRELGVEP